MPIMDFVKIDSNVVSGTSGEFASADDNGTKKQKRGQPNQKVNKYYPFPISFEITYKYFFDTLQ